MKKNYSSVIVFGLCVLVVVGCGGLKNMLPRKGQYFEGDTAQTAAQAIKDKVGKPFKVIEIFIDEDEFRVQAQDPGKPRNVDQYKYVAGFATGPEPIQLSGVYDAEKSGFAFDEIDFSAIPKFCKEALERADIEGGKIYRLTFQRGFALTDDGAGALGEPRWLIEINGSRENVTAAADPKGNLLGVDLSRTSKAADYKLLDEKELQKAQGMVKNMLGSRKDNIIGLTFYDKSLAFKVPNAENPKVSDDYKYDINGITRSGIVKMPVMRMSGEENFSVDDVDFANAARFFEKAKARVGMPNASLGVMTVRRRKSPFDNKGFRTEWHVSLKSGVNEASVDYDNDGNEMRVRKNGETISEEK